MSWALIMALERVIYSKCDAEVENVTIIMEGKTKKTNILVINKTIYKSLQNDFEKEKPEITIICFPFRASKATVALNAGA